MKFSNSFEHKGITASLSFEVPCEVIERLLVTDSLSEGETNISDEDLEVVVRRILFSDKALQMLAGKVCQLHESLVLGSLDVIHNQRNDSK
jgi:hypothetical protein